MKNIKTIEIAWMFPVDSHRSQNVLTVKKNCADTQQSIGSQHLESLVTIKVIFTSTNCTLLHWLALHCTALHCTSLYWTALHWTVLYCTALDPPINFTPLHNKGGATLQLSWTDFVLQIKCTIFWLYIGLRIYFDLYVPD